jgi:hypothetical protein
VLQKESKIGMLQMLIQPQYKRFYFVPDRQENWCFVSNSFKMLVAWAELKERSYGADCRIYTPENPTNKFANVWDTLFDEFVIAHILGWWGKAIMVRNLPLLWVLSIGFEVMEVGHLYAGLSLPSSFLLGMGCVVTMWKLNSKCLYSFLTNLCT